MTCIFCNKLVSPIANKDGVVTCTSCEPLAIARERLALNNYEGNYGKWLRQVDEQMVRNGE